MEYVDEKLNKKSECEREREPENVVFFPPPPLIHNNSAPHYVCKITCYGLYYTSIITIGNYLISSIVYICKVLQLLLTIKRLV